MGFLILVAIVIGAFVWFSKEEAKAKAELEKAFRARFAAIQERLDTDGVPIVEADLALQNGEICHWMGPCTWMETRSRAKRVGYRGTSISIPIVKGVRYRAGSFAPAVERTQELVPIDSGTLYITSKRLFFDGQGKNTSLPHAKILKITLALDGVLIDKAQGKDPCLKVGQDAAPLVAAILAKLT